MTRPRVSLCVPTHNRCEQLGTMLPALLDAVARHPNADQCEVCISDNASTDDTPIIIDKYAQSFPLRRIRQATNLGFAGNFAAVSQLASGETFAIFADDDQIEPGVVDLLWSAADLANAEFPLVLFDTLPGGDAVFRRMARPSGRTTIADIRDLLTRLGIFHVSFVSNMLFHRQTAMNRLTPMMLQSRYPHAALALTLLQCAPATFVPARLVRVTLPPDAGDQPLLTCVDMARVMAEFALVDPKSHGTAWSVYWFLLRMIPTAVYQERKGRCYRRPGQFGSLGLANVSDCYRHSVAARLVAIVLWLIAHLLPTALLGVILRRLSRHPR